MAADHFFPHFLLELCLFDAALCDFALHELCLLEAALFDFALFEPHLFDAALCDFALFEPHLFEPHLLEPPLFEPLLWESALRELPLQSSPKLKQHAVGTMRSSRRVIWKRETRVVVVVMVGPSRNW